MNDSQNFILKFSSVLKDNMKSFFRTEVEDPINEGTYSLWEDDDLDYILLCNNEGLKRVECELRLTLFSEKVRLCCQKNMSTYWPTSVLRSEALP